MFMWKRMVITCIALFGVLSAGYAYYNMNLQAANRIYMAGGNITARINIAPNGISGGSIGLQKGDKLYIGVDNPKDQTPLGWQLVNYMSNYQYYKTTPNGNGTNSFAADTPISGWYSLSTADIGKDHALDSWTYPDWLAPVYTTRLVSVLDNLNNTLAGNPLVTYRNLTIAYNVLLTNTTSAAQIRLGSNIRDSYNGKIAYFVGIDEKATLANENDYKFYSNYHSGDTQSGHGVSGNCEGVIDGTSGGFYWIPITTDILIRPSITLDVKTLFLRFPWVIKTDLRISQFLL